MASLSHSHGHRDQAPGRSRDDIPQRLGEEVIPPKGAAHSTPKSRLRTALIIVAITAVVTLLVLVLVTMQQPIR